MYCRENMKRVKFWACWTSRDCISRFELCKRERGREKDSINGNRNARREQSDSIYIYIYILFA